MRTTLDIDEALYRRVKAKAAMEGRTVTELVEAGLRNLIDPQPAQTSQEPVWKRFAGAWSGPEWAEDRRKVDAEIETAFEALEPEDRMTAEEVEASWKSRP